MVAGCAVLFWASILAGCGGGGEDLPCEQNAECAQGFACDKNGVCVAAEPLVITNGALPDAAVGQNYTIVITAGGGISPYRFSLREAPAWLSIDNDDGTLSGRPGNDDAGSRSFKVVVFDSSNHGNGQSAERSFTLVVRECSGPAECFVPDGGQCWKGTQQCQDGKLLSCVKTDQKSGDMAHCGDGCNACPGLRADHCDGECRCSDNAACEPGQACCNGRCIDIQSDIENCGGCGIRCDAEAMGVLTALCQHGVCDYDRCNQGYFECDGDRANGCEQVMDEQNCGDCGLVCGANAVCVLPGDGCTCAGGFGDCNNTQSDGCESRLDKIEHCGSCQRDCNTQLQNITGPDCRQGSCDYQSCVAGFGDCDQDRTDGCEESLWQTNACGNACQGRVDCTQAVQHASGIKCDSGTCDYGSCASGYGDCDNTRPNGCETNMRQTSSCGTSCGALHNCTQEVQNASNISCTTAGACNYGSCNNGFGDCDNTRPNGCETNIWQTTSCGTNCGNRVDCLPAVQHAGGTFCNQGACDYGFCFSTGADCDGARSNGCETPLSLPTSCGTNCFYRRDCTQTVQHATGITCGSGGNCAFSACLAGYGNCDSNSNNGCEANLWQDTNCRTTCSTGMNCTTLAHVQTGRCVTGTCEIQACASMYKNCNGNVSDGCETNLLNINNCGDCGIQCINNYGTTSCSLSGNTPVCNPQCTPGLAANCDNNLVNGCESLRTTTNCGACGVACSRAHATATCSDGTCHIQTCDRLWGDCDNIDSNGCEKDLSRDRFNCGACHRQCRETQPCVDGVCQN